MAGVRLAGGGLRGRPGGYVAAQSEILSEATGLPETLCHPLVYAVSAGVVLFGLRAVGIFETLGSAALMGCVAALVIGALGVGMELPVSTKGSAADALALFGMVMYGYYAFFSVPQVVKGLVPDGRRAARAVMAGLAINGLLIAAVAVVALGVSSTVTRSPSSASPTRSDRGRAGSAPSSSWWRC